MPNWRDAWRRWGAERLWIFATAGGAVAIFFVTFAVVSTLQGDSDSAAAPSVAAPPRLTASETVSAAPTERDDSRTRPTEPLAETRETEVQERPRVPLPAFDESLLIVGNDGHHGAILGGPGIVSSSTADRRTPWQLLIPSARIKAAIVAVGLTATGAFGAPDNPYVIGWWEDGPKPGERGNVLLDGHRDFTDIDDFRGTGVCWYLPDTGPGDYMIIRDNEARVHHLYTVTETASIEWNAPDGVEYLAPTPIATLTLVTCEGSFDLDAHNYSNRRIIVAELTESIPFVESGFEGDDGVYAGFGGSALLAPEESDADGEGEGEGEGNENGEPTDADESGDAVGSGESGDTAEPDQPSDADQPTDPDDPGDANGPVE